MVQPTREAVRAVEEKLLTENPFPQAVTGRNDTFASRVAEWAETSRRTILRDAERLRSKPDGEEPEEWELAALQHAAREWRIFETFRRLLEERWCPALLFRLHTKTDLFILCDPDADSSKNGFGERQRRLAKRGITGRFQWVEARRLVTVLGLLEEPAVPTTRGDGAPPASDPLPELGSAEATKEHVGGAPAEPSDVHPDPGGAADGSSEPLVDGSNPSTPLPPLLLDRVWSALPTYTKAQLEAVYERFGVGLWSQFGDRFYSSMRKPEMLTFVQRVVRHHACLDAAERLTECQLDVLHDWMRLNLSERYQRDGDLRIAARLFGDFQAAAALSRDGHGLSPEAWNRYRNGELRRIAAFCYHRFYEAETAPVHSGETV